MGASFIWMSFSGSTLISAINVLGSGSVLNPKDCVMIMFFVSHVDDSEWNKLLRLSKPNLS